MTKVDIQECLKTTASEICDVIKGSKSKKFRFPDKIGFSLINLRANGVSVSDISKACGISRSAIYSCCLRINRNSNQDPAKLRANAVLPPKQLRIQTNVEVDHQSLRKSTVTEPVTKVNFPSGITLEVGSSMISLEFLNRLYRVGG